jgi:hypothetical protein
MGSWDDLLRERRREEQLSGICDELREHANKALDAYEALKMRDLVMSSLWESTEGTIEQAFRDFSDSNVDGLQELACGTDGTGGLAAAWRTMEEGCEAEFEAVRRGLDGWYGDAAEAASFYTDQLADDYKRSITNISELESGVVAARDLIHTARQDLRNATDSFCSAVEQYIETENASEVTFSQVLAAGFGGAVCGLLTVSTGGAVAPIASGAAAAAAGVGGALSGLLELVPSGPVAGDTAMDVFSSYLDEIDKLKDHVERAADDLVNEINRTIGQLPDIQRPPDVSPGDTFDPDEFRADGLSDSLERAVRDLRVDLTSTPDPGRSTATAEGPIAVRLAGDARRVSRPEG